MASISENFKPPTVTCGNITICILNILNEGSTTVMLAGGSVDGRIKSTVDGSYTVSNETKMKGYY